MREGAQINVIFVQRLWPFSLRLIGHRVLPPLKKPLVSTRDQVCGMAAMAESQTDCDNECSAVRDRERDEKPACGWMAGQRVAYLVNMLEG